MIKEKMSSIFNSFADLGEAFEFVNVRLFKPGDLARVGFPESFLKFKLIKMSSIFNSFADLGEDFDFVNNRGNNDI